MNRNPLQRLLACAAILIASPSIAQDGPSLEDLSREAVEAFSQGDLEGAREALDRLVEIDEGNFVHYYNLACVHSVQGDADEAAEMLLQAVERGFTNVLLIRNDPSLRIARETDAVKGLLANWEKVLERRIDTDIERAKELYGRRYLFEKDADLRLAYASSYDEYTLREVQDEISRIHEWAMDNVFGGAHDDDLVADDDAWVLVVLPTQTHFREWAAAVYGAAARSMTQAIGGHYSHDEKQLVTMDLGGTIRHEFFHVLHWRCNARYGQMHPVWVQEGLCSLIEDYDLGPGGELVPVESWRTNQARFLAETGHLMPLEDLTRIPRARFTNTRPLAQYAQTRSFFLFLHREGKLRDWYTHFVEHYREDPTGAASIEAVFGQELEEVDKLFREFCRSLPKVAEDVKRGMASLGVEIDATGTGEGLRIARYVRRGTAGDLRNGDIITHIDHRPVRDYWELVRVLSSYEPGDTVTVNYRRVRLHQQTEVTLKAVQ